MNSKRETTDGASLARAYYDALDNHEYGRLESVLAPEFVHERPDMTLSGRAEFISFMRDERPMTETSHPIDRIYRAEDGVAVAGELVAASGEQITGFVDLFTVSEGRIERIETFTDH